MKEEFEAFYYVIITVNGEVDICMPAHELVEQGLVVSEWDPFFSIDEFCIDVLNSYQFFNFIDLDESDEIRVFYQLSDGINDFPVLEVRI